MSSYRSLSVIVVLAVTGCSALRPDALGFERAHYSHISARSADEDSLDVLQGYARWRLWQRCSVTASVGARLHDRGFYGPSEVSALRGGCEWENSID